MQRIGRDSFPEASRVSNLIYVRSLDDSMKGAHLCGQFDVHPLHPRVCRPPLRLVVFPPAVPLLDPPSSSSFFTCYLRVLFLLHFSMVSRSHIPFIYRYVYYFFDLVPECPGIQFSSSFIVSRNTLFLLLATANSIYSIAYLSSPRPRGRSFF